MELLRCPECRRRFIVAENAGNSRWRCPHCGCELTLIVSRVRTGSRTGFAPDAGAVGRGAVDQGSPPGREAAQ